MESCQQTQDTGRLWRLIARTTGKKPRVPPNQPISFNNRQTTADQEIANSFCKQFTTTVRHTSDPAARRVRRQILRDHPLDHTFSPFTVDLVKKAIKESSNSIAAGPDGLTMHHLKHLGPRGYEYLTSLYNLSIQAADIPSIGNEALLSQSPRLANLATLGPLSAPSLSSAPPSRSSNGFYCLYSTSAYLLRTVNMASAR